MELFVHYTILFKAIYFHINYQNCVIQLRISLRGFQGFHEYIFTVTDLITNSTLRNNILFQLQI